MQLKDVRKGMKFGRLKIIGEIVRDKKSVSHVLCQCDCKKEKMFRVRNLIRGVSRSCGCLHNELLIKRCTTHNLSKDPTFNSWANMVQRCRNKNNPIYKRYGAVGIDIDERWLVFSNFLSDMGLRPKNTSIDRIDNSKGYTKENCRWANAKEQSRNRTDNVFFNSECATDASIRLGGGKEMVAIRIRAYKWNKERAFTTPKIHNKIKLPIKI